MSSLTSNLVKYVRDYDRSRPGLTGALALLAESTLTFDSELSSARQSLPSVFLLEALAAPLAHGDAADEKLAVCSALAASMAKHVRNGLSRSACFKNNDQDSDDMQRLALRCLAALTRIWNSSSLDSSQRKAKSWAPVFAEVFDYSLRANNEESEIFLSAVLDCSGLDCLPKNFARRIWKERVLEHPDKSQDLMTKTLGALGEDDLLAVLEDAAKLPLVRNLGQKFWSFAHCLVNK